MKPFHELTELRDFGPVDPDADLAAALSDRPDPLGPDSRFAPRSPHRVAEAVLALARLAREHRRAARALRRAAAEADVTRRLLATIP